MHDNKRGLLIILKVFITLIIFYLAVQFESPRPERLMLLVAFFGAYLLMSFIRGYLIKERWLYEWSFIIDVLLVFFLEYNSKFVINYFFHIYYVVILLEASFTLSRNKSLIIGMVTVVMSLVKYMQLLYFESNFANISEMVFFTLISAFVLVVVSFAQYHREEKEKKDLLYEELLKTHNMLEEYTKKVEELTIIQERNRIARDIHDTLGHSMTTIIMEMELADYMLEEDKEKAKKMLEGAKESAREGLKKIRAVVETLKPEESISDGTVSIKNLVDDFSNKTQVKIQLHVTGYQRKLTPTINATLYRVVQEALTNAVRHGNATSIEIHIDYLADKISFTIKDNGVGSEEILEGFGIQGIKERLEALNGSVIFYSKEGFTVTGFIPWGEII